MPFKIFHRFYTPELCRAEPTATFIFGDNLQGYGKAGQAIIRDEPNAMGFPTKIKPAMSADSFFRDKDLAVVIDVTNPKVALLVRRMAEGRIVYWPRDGIGTGLANLQNSSLLIWGYYTCLKSHLQNVSNMIDALTDSEGPLSHD